MKKSSPEEIEQLPDFLSSFLRDFFHLTDVDQAAQHWSLRTPGGRAWLTYRIGQDGHPVVESQVLRWALVAELARARIPGVSFDMAVGLVSHGITLRNLKAKSKEALANQRWSCIAGRLNADETFAQVVERESQDPELNIQLADSIVFRTEHFVRRYFERQFERWRDAAKLLDRDFFSVEYYDLLVVSDFHLAAGNHPTAEGLARFSPAEDFFFDDAFFRFLYHVETERRSRGGYPYEQVLNGDSIDFAQLLVKESPDGEIDPETIPPLLLGATASPVWDHLMTLIEEVYGDGTVERIRAAHIDLYGDILEKQSVPDARDQEVTWQAWWGDDWVRRFSYEPGAGPEKESRGEATWQDIAWDANAEKSYQTWAAQQQADRGPAERTVLAMRRTEALGQLHSAYIGHPRFFQGLAWFLAQGNRLVILRGNHDPQWYWPEVQLAFAGWLKTASEKLKVACEHPVSHEMPVPCADITGLLPDTSAEDFVLRADFTHSWFYYRHRLAYIEHGNQQEVVDLQRFFLAPVVSCRSGAEQPIQDDELKLAESPPKPEDWLPAFKVSAHEKEIDPPLGSLGLVYFVNNLEIEFPNFERSGYQKIYWRWLISVRSRLLVKLVIPSIFRVLRSWWRWTFRRLAGVRQCHEDRLEEYASLSGLPVVCVKKLDQTRWVATVRNPLFEPIFRATMFVVLAAPLLALLVGIVVGIRYFDDLFPSLRSGEMFVKWLCSRSDLIPCLEASGNLVILDLLMSTGKAFLFGFLPYQLGLLVRNFIGLGEDYVYKPSRKIARILRKYDRDVPYLLFGHDHAHNSQPLVLPDEDNVGLPIGRWYLNTGTWLHLYDKQRKRFLRTPHEYALVRMIDTHRVLAARSGEHMLGHAHTRPTVELLRWNDHVSALEPAEIFMGKDEK